MQMPETENLRQQKRGTGVFAWILGLLMVPFLFIGACFAAPYVLVMRWRQQHREDALKTLMKSRGRFMGWAEFLRSDAGIRRHLHRREILSEGAGAVLVDAGECLQRIAARDHRLVHDAQGRAVCAVCFVVPRALYERGRWQRDPGGDVGRAEEGDLRAVGEMQAGVVKKARWIEVAPPEILPKRR